MWYVHACKTFIPVLVFRGCKLNSWWEDGLPFFLRGCLAVLRILNWGKCVMWSCALRRRVKNSTGRHTFFDMNNLRNHYEHVMKFMHATPYPEEWGASVYPLHVWWMPCQKALACLATLRRGCVRNLAANMTWEEETNPHPTSPPDLCEIINYIERWVELDNLW